MALVPDAFKYCLVAQVNPNCLVAVFSNEPSKEVCVFQLNAPILQQTGILLITVHNRGINEPPSLPAHGAVPLICFMVNAHVAVASTAADKAMPALLFLACIFTAVFAQSKPTSCALLSASATFCHFK
jgi:hypothetical protein